jgi:Flp pilus assembly protein TadB
MKKFLKRNPELIIFGIAYIALAVVAYQLIEISLYHAITVAVALAVIVLCDRMVIKKRTKNLNEYALAMKKYNN